MADMVEVTIDIEDGKSIVAAITRGAVEQTDLEIGSEVVALVTSTEVLVGDRVG